MGLPRCGTRRNDAGIARIGLGHWSRGRVHIPEVARMDHGNGPFGHGESRHPGVLLVPARVAPEQSGLQRAAVREAGAVVGHPRSAWARAGRRCRGVLWRPSRPTNPGRSLLHRTHTPLQAALSCRGELWARATVRARPGGGVTTRLLYDL